MSLSDKFYSDYSKIRTNSKYQIIPTKEVYDEICKCKLRKNVGSEIRRNKILPQAPSTRKLSQKNYLNRNLFF